MNPSAILGLRRAVGFFVGVVGLVVGPQAASAEEVRAEAPNAVGTSSAGGERGGRNGLAVGATMGVAMAGATGYPNEPDRIGNAADFTGSGLGVGYGGNVILVGALAESLNFGIWFGSGMTANGNWRTTGAGGGIRAEAFPLIRLAPGWRNLGIGLQVGVGSATIRPERGVLEGANGLQSYVGLGVFHEWSSPNVFGGKLAIGPSLDYSAIFARSIERHALSMGARVAFYTGI